MTTLFLDADGNAPKRRKKSTENAAASSAQRSGTSEEKHGAVKESTIGDASSSDDESKVVEPLPAPIKKRKVRITNLPKQDTETVNSTDSHAGNGTVKETGSASAK